MKMPEGMKRWFLLVVIKCNKNRELSEGRFLRARPLWAKPWPLGGTEACWGWLYEGGRNRHGHRAVHSAHGHSNRCQLPALAAGYPPKVYQISPLVGHATLA